MCACFYLTTLWLADSLKQRANRTCAIYFCRRSPFFILLIDLNNLFRVKFKYSSSALNHWEGIKACCQESKLAKSGFTCITLSLFTLTRVASSTGLIPFYSNFIPLHYIFTCLLCTNNSFLKLLETKKYEPSHLPCHHSI